MGMKAKMRSVIEVMTPWEYAIASIVVVVVHFPVNCRCIPIAPPIGSPHWNME